MSNNAQERSNARILLYVHAEKAPCKSKHHFNLSCSVSILRAHDMIFSRMAPMMPPTFSTTSRSFHRTRRPCRADLGPIRCLEMLRMHGLHTLQAESRPTHISHSNLDRGLGQSNACRSDVLCANPAGPCMNRTQRPDVAMCCPGTQAAARKQLLLCSHREAT